jgi:hypothetical protein
MATLVTLLGNGILHHDTLTAWWLPPGRHRLSKGCTQNHAESIFGRWAGLLPPSSLWTSVCRIQDKLPCHVQPSCLVILQGTILSPGSLQSGGPLAGPSLGHTVLSHPCEADWSERCFLSLLPIPRPSMAAVSVIWLNGNRMQESTLSTELLEEILDSGWEKWAT